MTYQIFATLYDQLMEEAPYDQWVHYIKKAQKEKLEGLTVLDIGCGTGELLLRLHAEGANVIGVDASAHMLAIARKKCAAACFEPLLIEQSMANLQIGNIEPVDIVTIFCDSLNYLESAKEVQQTFINCYKSLKEGGLLLFDVHSIFKIEEKFIGNTFADDYGDIAYIWTSFPGEHSASVEHDLSFFLHHENDAYIKYEECHKQRTFSVNEYKQWLIQAGFQKDIHISADFTMDPPTAESERIFFIAQK